MDAAQVADAYSQLSGLIAGFAFSSIVVLITHRIGAVGGAGVPDDHMQNALLLLFSCFMGMTTSALAYSMLSGMKDFVLALEVGHVIAGTGFGVAGLMGLLGIHQLILRAGLRIEREIGIVSGSLAPLLTAAYQVVGLHRADGSSGFVFGGSVVLVILVAASIAPHLGRGDAGPAASALRSYSKLSICSLGVSAMPSVGVSVLAATGGTARVPVWPAYAAVTTTFLMCAWVTVVFHRQAGRARSAAVPE